MLPKSIQSSKTLIFKLEISTLIALLKSFVNESQTINYESLNMKSPLTFIMLSIILTWFGCTPKYAEVEFGQGGGVTNDYQAFVVKEDGNLFAKKGEFSELTLIRKLEKSELKTVYKKLKAADIINLDVNTPHNIYQFIEIKNEEGVSVNKVIWGDPQGKLTIELKDLYDYLLSIAKQ